jgi:MSHA pilin protein MshC
MRDRGFTLVELITIIIIVGILAVYAAPRFFASDGDDLTGADASLVSLLRVQQQRAMQNTSGAGAYGVLIEEAAGEFYVRPVNAGAATPRDDATTLRISAPNTLQPTGQFEFNGLGCVGECGAGTVQFTLSGASTRQVCVNSQGYIRSGSCS